MSDKIRAFNISTGKWELTDDPDDLDFPEGTRFVMPETYDPDATVRMTLTTEDDEESPT